MYGKGATSHELGSHYSPPHTHTLSHYSPLHTHTLSHYPPSPTHTHVKYAVSQSYPQKTHTPRHTPKTQIVGATSHKHKHAYPMYPDSYRPDTHTHTHTHT
eukprot:GHVR01190378.1.p1 GENE.GHVR01190378.1~~GHVR01190378.1.p1  ORF type:complete len:101 (-),score=59.74 GHVR01190378.1:262-564(-)